MPSAEIRRVRGERYIESRYCRVGMGGKVEKPLNKTRPKLNTNNNKVRKNKKCTFNGKKLVTKKVYYAEAAQDKEGQQEGLLTESCTEDKRRS